MNPGLVYNIDANGCSDWEERRSYEGIILVELADGPIHFGVSRWVKHQTMLVCVNASGETPCPLTVTADRSTTRVFRDGMEEAVDLKVQVARSTYVDATIFRDYLRDALIPIIEEFREANIRLDEPDVLLMNNCSARISLQ
jgi:hypothetical protein